MIKIIILSFFFFLSSLAIAQEKPPSKIIQIMMNNLEIDYFVSGIEKLKRYQSIEEIDEFDYRLKPFQKHANLWTVFDEENYQAKFIHHLQESFTSKDLYKINDEFLNKPFLVKILKRLSINRDIFTFLRNLSETNSKITNIDEKKLVIIDKIYQIHNYTVQLEQLNTLLKEFINKEVNLKSNSSASGDQINISLVLLEERLKNSEMFLKHYLVYELQGLKIREINEYIRIINKDPIYKVFATFIINYHFDHLRSFFEINQSI